MESTVGRLCNEVVEDSKAAEEIEEAMKEDKKKKEEEEEVKNYMGRGIDLPMPSFWPRTCTRDAETCPQTKNKQNEQPTT